MQELKGRDIQLTFLVKSAVAQRYYARLNRRYDTEAARKQFNQDRIDRKLLIEVMREVCEEEIAQIEALHHDT